MNTPWWEHPLVGFDTETTGVDVDTDRIVTANLTFDVPGHEPKVRNFLFNPGVEIPEEATAVHGITTEYAIEHGQEAAAGLAELRETLTNCLRYPVVAFNGSFDFTILDRELARHGLDPLGDVVAIDPFVMDKAIDRFRRGPRTLAAVSAHYGVTLDNAHSADADALAAAQIARALGRTGKFPADPVELHALQVTWRAEQQASFEAYLRGKGSTEILPRQWPIIPAA